MGHTVVVSDTKVIDFDAQSSVFEEVGATLRRTDAKRPEELVRAARGADAIIVDSRTQVTERVVADLDLAVVGRAGIGVDNIDVAAAAERGVTVVNVPDYCLDEVSTHALALMLACLRRVPAFDEAVKSGGWDWSLARPTRRLEGSTVGLVAFGKIARRLAEKIRGFPVDTVAYDPYVEAGAMAEYGVSKVDFEELLAGSDLVSVHAPLTDETRGMFDADAFASLPDHAIVVNTGRGPLIEEGALYDALRSGEIAAAGLDVMAEEPPGDSPLFERDDVVITPHAAWYSEASRTDLSRHIAEDVARVLRGEEPRARVDPGSGWF